MRGKRNKFIKQSHHNRITPAGAGKTALLAVVFFVKPDHPRRCGENFHPLRSELATLGSPPQVRGKLHQILPVTSPPRITPAGAGKTPMQYIERRKNRDHPRRCGENPLYPSNNARGLGSPPQVRGKRADKFGSATQYGITPAGAGKTVNSLYPSVMY